MVGEAVLDQIVDRCAVEGAKWHRYAEDVLPLWVADMDFRAPDPVIQALRERVEHGVYGYPGELPELRPVVVERIERLYDWRVSPESLVFLPGIVTGFNLAIRALTFPGDGVLAQTPVYYPILHAPGNHGCTLDEMELTLEQSGSYSIDYDSFEVAITDRTRVFVLCNPHNPVGRVYRRDELERMAEVCLRHDMVICSDEIHCDLLFPGYQHLPIATLSPEIAERTITLMAPSKTYNIAGLQCSVAIIENSDLRKRFLDARGGLVSWVGSMAQAAALAAYRDGQPWLDGVLRYLESNLDCLCDYVATELPGVTMCRPEGTYLAWLDCREATLPSNPHEFFLEQAKVAMNDGTTFGKGGEGFVRLNFACCRAVLLEALQRMRNALLALA
jgi:cystathionine beta-lyase